MKYFKTKNGKLYLGNCLEVMKNMDDNSIDTIEIDKNYCEIAKQRIKNIEVEEKTTEKIAKKGIELFFDQT